MSAANPKNIADVLSETYVNGILYFTTPMETSKLIAINQCIDKLYEDDLPLDLKISRNFDGIVWNGAGLPSTLPHQIELLLCRMKKTYPDFGLKGVFHIIQPNHKDTSKRRTWRVVIKADGELATASVNYATEALFCPYCHAEFPPAAP